MKYLPIIIAFAEVAKPILTDIENAVAEGKGDDPVTVKLQKIVNDLEDALTKVMTAI